VGEDDRRCFKPGAGKTEYFKDCPTCPEMVVVPSGHFAMGSPPDEPNRRETEDPRHRVVIGRPFAVGRFAVTRGEFAAFVGEANYPMGANCRTFEEGRVEVRAGRSYRDAGFPQDDRHPAVCVFWSDAKAFVTWLSKKTHKGYRLLSEAEREFVTRAGTTTPFWWGRSITARQANFDGNYTYAGGSAEGEYRQRTVPVDSFKANTWGLYNVHGNVWDWTEDCWNANYNGAPTDGSAWISGDCSRRVVRGGAWDTFPWILRSAHRDRGFAVGRISVQGFRLARTL